MEYYVTNRDIIKNFKINTGTSGSPTYTPLCTTSELTLDTSFDTAEWYTYCDAIQRSIITGVAMSISGTIKIDVNNTAITTLLSKVHTLIANGTISQFNNILAQFDLLTGVQGGVLEYTTYTVNTRLTLESLGGSAESEGEFDFTMTINGSATGASS
ncbi:MAG: hypothetical protein GX038_06710 [Erysipelothrix sp.]|nr:hypothetical protein [Erysipelothrix sp.]